jgi:hypothetical protein
MGTCYYLWRDDNKTAYDLGKEWSWGEVFGCPRHTSIGTPMTLAPQDAPELADLLLMHLAEKDRELREEFGDNHAPIDYYAQSRIDYYAFICADIARWSEGQPFEFISEHDHRYENASMDAYDRGQPRGAVTGSRFNSWRARGPRCACADPTIDTLWSDVAYCTTCHRYKMCPICGEFAAAGEVACNKHRHRAGRR